MKMMICMVALREYNVLSSNDSMADVGIKE